MKLHSSVPAGTPASLFATERYDHAGMLAGGKLLSAVASWARRRS